MNKKILIVDDEEPLLALLGSALKHHDVEVITATTLATAEFAINNTFIDLVLADVRLTGVLGREGLELLSYVQEKSPGTLVIIMSAYGSEEIKEEAYERGASHYYDKPFELVDLFERLRELGILRPDSPQVTK